MRISDWSSDVCSSDLLEHELQSAMDALFMLFGCVGIAVVALVSLATQPAAILTRITYLTSEILPRLGQTVVVGASAITLMRIGTIPAILRRSLSVRHRIAIDEAQIGCETGREREGPNG